MRRHMQQLKFEIYRGRAARIRFTEKLSAKFRADKYLVNFFPMLRPGSKAAEREKDNGNHCN